VNDTPTSLDESIANCYRQAPEEARLDQVYFQLERSRTQELIERFAPAPPATVLDVGGAAGPYAFWLAASGYSVHLVDPVPRLVDEARRRSADENRPLASAEVGDARALSFPDGSAAMVLLLGPLYHLTATSDRAQALAEGRRVLKPGGLLFAAAISRYASALDGLGRDLFQDARFTTIVDQDLRDGQHRNPTERLDYFTTAYFHRPEDLRTEFINSGLDLKGVMDWKGPDGFSRTSLSVGQIRDSVMICCVWLELLKQSLRCSVLVLTYSPLQRSPEDRGAQIGRAGCLGRCAPRLPMQMPHPR
jgi:ubiquinone/menaquinone biosynthesis C-methylase UbiE